MLRPSCRLSEDAVEGLWSRCKYRSFTLTSVHTAMGMQCTSVWAARKLQVCLHLLGPSCRACILHKVEQHMADLHGCQQYVCHQALVFQLKSGLCESNLQRNCAYEPNMAEQPAWPAAINRLNELFLGAFHSHDLRCWFCSERCLRHLQNYFSIILCTRSSMSHMGSTSGPELVFCTGGCCFAVLFCTHKQSWVADAATAAQSWLSFLSSRPSSLKGNRKPQTIGKLDAMWHASCCSFLTVMQSLPAHFECLISRFAQHTAKNKVASCCILRTTLGLLLHIWDSGKNKMHGACVYGTFYVVFMVKLILDYPEGLDICDIDACKALLIWCVCYMRKQDARLVEVICCNCGLPQLLEVHAERLQQLQQRVEMHKWSKTFRIANDSACNLHCCSKRG